VQDLPDLLTPIVGARPSLLFSGLLAIHIAAGALGYSAGLLAALSPKRAGRHPRLGTIYYWALAAIFVTATGMSVLHRPEDAYLFVLGSLSFSSASVGYAARKIRWRGWLSFHIGGMSASVIVLATAFYVDNGPKFASQVPTLVYWLGPSVVGIPLLVRAFVRHSRVMADLQGHGAQRDASRACEPRTAHPAGADSALQPASQRMPLTRPARLRSGPASLPMISKWTMRLLMLGLLRGQQPQR